MTDNIQELLREIKKDISLVEKENYKQPVFDEIENDFLHLAELIKLFLISERDSYYGYILMNMHFRVDFSTESIAGIKLNEFPPVFVTNPLILCKFSIKEIIYIFCHEIDHVVFNHPTEMVKSNPENDPEIFKEFNLAADAAVNDRLNYEIKNEKHGFMSAPNGLITSSVLAKMYQLGHIYSMENYAYYFSLIHQTTRGVKNRVPNINGQQSVLGRKIGESESNNGSEAEQQAENAEPQAGNSEMQKENAESQTEDSETQTENAEPQAGNSGKPTEDADSQTNGKIPDKIVTAARARNIKDHDWQNGEDAEDLEAAVRELVNSSVGMMNEETRGLMPADFMSQVKMINAPPVINWEKVLKKYVGTIVAGKQKTRTRLNRRQPERFDLSGSMDSKIIKIVVAIDTSGSVDDEMIAKILNEIFSILSKRRHDITIIECDAKIQRVYKARNAGDIQTKMKGRGGTYFTPVIEYINERKYYRDALLIYFTDGFGEWEIPRPKTYRNMWVIMQSAENLSLKEPYGVVLPLK